LSGSHADKETPEERHVAIAQLRGMSREDRLALLMRNFSVDCAELGGARAAARQRPENLHPAADGTEPAVTQARF
jgi:hypothetical protein